MNVSLTVMALVFAGLVLWVILGVIVTWVLSRTLRNRDKQIPHD